MKAEPTHTKFGFIEPNRALDEARSIVKKYPMFQKSNGSGKFYQTYETWQFHKSSDLPLLKNFVSLIERQKDSFFQEYKRELNINFLMLSYVKDSSREMCIYHRDGTFWNGQFHLTILGNANILVKFENDERLINMENGSVWYLNGTEYQHKIKTSKGERFELTAPVSERPEDIKEKLKIVSSDGAAWLDSKHPAWLELRKRQVGHIKKAIAKGIASNLEIASFNTEVED